jgi:hypothetical protein
VIVDVSTGHGDGCSLVGEPILHTRSAAITDGATLHESPRHLRA